MSRTQTESLLFTFIKFNPHDCPGRALLVPLNRQENQGCRVLSKLDQSDTAAKQ